MQRAKLLLLTVLFFAQISIVNSQKAPSYNFQTKVDDFVKKYQTNFTIVKDSKVIPFALDTKTKPVWSSKVTLKSKTPFINKYNQTVYQRLYLSFYQYENNESCRGALDTLLNCFGTDCAKINWGVQGQTVKTTPGYYLIGRKEIIVCQIYCEHSDDFWLTIQNNLRKSFADDDLEIGVWGIIDAGCGGPIYFRKN